MRGYRMFSNVSSVAVEWRILGLRLRVLVVLWAFFWGILGGTLLLVSLPLGVSSMVFGLVTVLMFAGYTSRVDPDFVMRETTLLRMLWVGTKNRFRTNDPVRD